MKNVLRLSFLCFTILFYASCQHTKQDEVNNHSHGPDSAPSSWMYSQRAFPNGINRSVKAAAVKQFQSMKHSADFRYDKSWKAVGPTNIGGRFTDVVLHPTDVNTIYAGSSVGGVWQSIDKGHNWSLIFEEPGGVSIGNLAISPVNPDILYIGTGEANGSATSGAFFGNGIYKSEDGGISWAHSGLPKSDHIGRIVCHPENEEVVYVAVAGKLYGKNTERGLYKSTDGGQSWQQKLFINDSTAVIDVALSAADPDVIFAATWERTRFAEGRVYGGFSTALHRSKDGGETWEELSEGLPNNLGDLGRIGIAVSQRNPDIVYASFTYDVITNQFLGIYKSQDQGDTWTDISDQEELGNVFSSFGWFFGNVRIHPDNLDEVFIMGLRTYHNTNEETWENWTPGVHVDQHGMEFHPMDSDFRVICNDGGIYITEDGGLNFRHVETIDNNQFYECAIHPTLEDTYLGGTQDNGTLLTVAAGNDGYERISGGDGFGVQFDKVDPTYFYVTSQFGSLRRASSLEPYQSINVRPPSDLAARRNWNTPFVTIPNVFGGIIYGAEHILMSLDTGTTWEIISPDLTNGPYPDSNFGSITCLAVSDLNQDIIMAGTSDGNVQITTDGGSNWELISNDLPYLEVSSVATDPFDEATVYVTFSGYRSNDYLPHVLKSADYGATWTDISSNLPETPINEIVIDPLIPDQYYLATDLGVFFTSDGGTSWNVLGKDFPNTIVADLDLHADRRLLLAGTFGRSMFTYNLPSEPVSSIDEVQTSLLKIYPNPTSDILFIEMDAEEEVSKIEITTNSGESIRTFHSLPNSIDVGDLNPGIYNVRVNTEKRIRVERFVKL